MCGEICAWSKLWMFWNGWLWAKLDTKLTPVSILPATISRTGTLMPHMKTKVSCLRPMWQLINYDIGAWFLLFEKMVKSKSRQQLADNRSRRQSLYTVFCLPLLQCFFYLPTPEIYSLFVCNQHSNQWLLPEMIILFGFGFRLYQEQTSSTAHESSLLELSSG